MIGIAPVLLRAIEDHARTAYPNEACGLLLGRREAEGGLRVHAVKASPNRAPDPARAFAIDPSLHLALLSASGVEQSVIGVYHSHPDGAPAPSAADRAQANDPELAWLVIAADAGGACATRAFRYDGGDFVADVLSAEEHA